METLFIYLIKSSGLIGMFYLAYYFLLRKETFFASNRWFLLLGLITSVVLPLVVFTKIIWVEPTPIALDFATIPVTMIPEKTFGDYLPMLFSIAYCIGIASLLLKFVFDFYSLQQVLKGKTIEQQADFKFIDIRENVAPFSYFNTIVYNSGLYSESELENILEHEKIHSEQNHTVDVLISRLFCILFWFNPMVWLYKKAIVQNLEFIADSEALKKITDKKAYQFTLLKITTHQNCVAITNHFYQSLIKKRIVMLNKNQSKKRNSWKYAVVLPLLVGFVFLFQIKVIAQEKIIESQEIETKKSDENNIDIYKIQKNTTDKELAEKTALLKDNYGIAASFSKVKRNSNNELIAITVELKKGDEISRIMKTQGTEAIKDFGIVVSKDSKGMLAVDFATAAKINIGMNNKNGIVSPDEPSKLTIKKEIYINDSKMNQEDLDKLDPDEIESMDVIKNTNKQEIRIVTKKNIEILNEDDLPSPPSPPSPPNFNLKAPNPPAFPKAPKTPNGDPINGDKKAWKEFEIKMKDYEAKIEKIEPEMIAFEKKMEEFEKQMEPFNKAMEAYEKKMELYQQQMEKYHSKTKEKKE